MEMENAKVVDDVHKSRYGRKYRRPVRCSACENCTHGLAVAVLPPVNPDVLGAQLARVLKVSDEGNASAAEGVVVAVAAAASSARAPAGTLVEEGTEMPEQKQSSIDDPTAQQQVTVEEIFSAIEVDAPAVAAAPAAPATAAASGNKKKRNSKKGRGKGDAAKRAPLASKAENGTQGVVEYVKICAITNGPPQSESLMKKEQNQPKGQSEPKGKKGQKQNQAKDGKENVVATREPSRRQRSMKELQATGN